MGSERLLPKKRVLVGEDSDESRLLIQAYLKSLDLEFEGAADGETLIKLARSKSFDLLLVDIGLPILSGLEAVKRLRKEGLRTPIVSISGNSESADLEKYRAAGFTDSLAKPFNRKQFLTKVSELLSLTPIDDGQDGGLVATWEPIAEQFADQLPAKLKELYTVLEAQDYTQLAFLAHRVRAAGMFGFTSVSEICAEIDVVLKNGERHKVPALLEKLSGAVDEIRRAKSPLH